jgi:hypothetical protein
LGIDLFKSVLMYSNGAICLIKLLFKIGLFTVHIPTRFVAAIECAKIPARNGMDTSRREM